jgi:hypothetical protein
MNVAFSFCAKFNFQSFRGSKFQSESPRMWLASAEKSCTIAEIFLRKLRQQKCRKLPLELPEAQEWGIALSEEFLAKVSRCVYCHHELPGSETLCRECFEAGYHRLLHPRPWWRQVRPRLNRSNALGFLVLFVFCFILLRFDFPQFHSRHMKTAGASAVIAALIACTSFFHEGRRE